jgi:hypothetical protein
MLLLVASALTACAEGSASGDPGARPLPMGQSCDSIRAELNKLDARGAQPKVQAAAEGRRLGPADMEVVNRYNSLLGQYLGARCHVM